MGGFPIYVIDKFLNILVDIHGWHVVHMPQDANKKNTTRSIKGVYSPGTNLSSHKDTNNIVSIYIELVKSRIRRVQSHSSSSTLFCGMSSIDVLTGQNCIYEHWSENADSAIAYDEIQKFITVKNPKEIIIYIDGLILDEDEICGLFNLKSRPYRLYMEGVKEKKKKPKYQQEDILILHKEDLYYTKKIVKED